MPVYLAVQGFGAAAFAMYAVVASVYRIVEAGLNPLELILVGTVLEVSAFLFEVPTGVVADVYGRRLSVIVGTFLVGAGFIIEGLFPMFGVILVAQVLWGVGSTFDSGARQAWIADEIGGGRVGRVFLKGVAGRSDREHRRHRGGRSPRQRIRWPSRTRPGPSPGRGWLDLHRAGAGHGPHHA